MAHAMESDSSKQLVLVLVVGTVVVVLWNLYQRYGRRETLTSARDTCNHVANWVFSIFGWGEEDQVDWGTAGTLQMSIPVASEVVEDQQPTLLWLVQVLEVVAVIIANAISDVGKIEESDLRARLGVVHDKLLKSIDYQRKQMKRETIGERPIKVPEEPEEIASFKDLDKEIRSLLREAQEKKYPTIPTPETYDDPTLYTAPPHPLEDYEALFTVIPLPEIARTFQTDESFAMFRVAGPNPMSIKGVTKSILTLLIGDRITDADFNAVMQTTEDSLEKAGAEGRLFVVNYKELTRTYPKAPNGSVFVTNPIAVFAEPLGGRFIKPVGIQLGQDQSELIMANTPDTFRWQIAKQIVQVADTVYHELIAHLALTHLVIEAFSISTQRNLSKEHALYKLLTPHFEGTNYINNLAATVLVAEDGGVDNIIAGGVHPRLISLQELAVNARNTFDFTNRMPDVELAARNVDLMQVFPYRDDALLLWDVILEWASDYVDLYYQTDQSVVDDEELQAWASDIVENGRFLNFQPPQVKEELVRILGMVMFTSSVQHAAVNYPQGTFMTYAPAFTGLIWDNLPSNQRPATEEDWLKMLPPIPTAQEQIAVLHLLGNVYHGRLGEYRSNEFPYVGTLDPKVEEALARFNKNLENIEAVIVERNEHRGAFKYDFLLPSWIPASINI